MGHRFSKTAANNIAAAKTSTWKTTNNNNNTTTEQLQAFHTTTNIIPIPNGRQPQQQQAAQFVGPTINLQIQESPNITDTTGAHCIGATTSINNLTATAAAGSSSILQIPQQQQQQYNTNSISSSSLTSVNNLSCGGRQIIIKIQLAKMENGNETTTTAATTTTTTATATASTPSSVQYLKDTSLENLTADCNLNSTESSSSSSSSTVTTSTAAATQVLNLTLNSGHSSCNSNTITATAGLTSLFSSTSLNTTSSSSSASTSTLYRTAGSSLTKNNNNNYFNTNSMGNNNINNNSISSCSIMPTTSSRFERPERFSSSLQFNDEIVEQNIGEIVEYCEVLEQQQLPTTSSCNNPQMLTINEETDNNEPNACCRRKSKSLAANANNGSSTNSNSSSNTGTKAKSRCRKCSCRDAFRRFLDPSLSRSSSSSSSNKAAKQQQQQKEQKRNKSQDRHSTNNNNNNTNTTTISNSLMNNNNNSMHSNNTNITARATTATTTAIVMPSVNTNQVSLWTSANATPHVNDVIIPLTTPTPPQFVVVQCAIVNSLPPTPNTIMSASSTSANGLISIAHDISPTTSSSSTTNNEFKLCPNNNNNALTAGSQTTVHSQVDYVHYLVPDLERITNSSFYWGKMDRYEAERLLEGKPEGTFLLRDSAQEEFLFSVTFRKYGRSLHARIEQSGHRFSFDCHDPCVFTAPTVTGLLEHYKDPACVMFFEPMLTIPLHRRNCFSLQKLCRATIVSNTTYDGINELELPARLKAYLKEYHYKQKLRVKFNEPSYTIHCK